MSCLASAFYGGAFAGLESLALSYFDGADGGFAIVCHANILKMFSLQVCRLGREGLKPLGRLFAHGALSCLEDLDLQCHEINDLGIIYFTECLRAMKRSLPLKTLCISYSKMTYAGLQAVLYLIEGGYLPELEKAIWTSQ